VNHSETKKNKKQKSKPENFLFLSCFSSISSFYHSIFVHIQNKTISFDNFTVLSAF